MPADTNPAGDIFGGWLMSQMDLAAGTLAGQTARGRCSTIAVEGMIFLRPVKEDDEVSLYTEMERVGRTSMTIHDEAWRRARHTGAREQVTDASFIFVALHENGRPRPVLAPERGI